MELNTRCVSWPRGKRAPHARTASWYARGASTQRRKGLCRDGGGQPCAMRWSQRNTGWIKGEEKKTKKGQAREILIGFQHTYGKIHTLPGRGVLYNFAGVLVWWCGSCTNGLSDGCCAPGRGLTLKLTCPAQREVRVRSQGLPEAPNFSWPQPVFTVWMWSLWSWYKV